MTHSAGIVKYVPNSPQRRKANGGMHSLPLPRMIVKVSDRIRGHLGQQQKQEKTGAFIQQLKTKGRVEILI